jgi:hypothetical protein
LVYSWLVSATPVRQNLTGVNDTGLELGLAQAASPVGNLAARQTDQPKVLACLARGKCYLKEGISQENSEAAGTSGTSGEKVVSRSYQSLSFTYLYEPRLLHSIKGQFHETIIQFGVLGSSDLKLQLYYSNISGVNFI